MEGNSLPQVLHMIVKGMLASSSRPSTFVVGDAPGVEEPGCSAPLIGRCLVPHVIIPWFSQDVN